MKKKVSIKNTQKIKINVSIFLKQKVYSFREKRQIGEIRSIFEENTQQFFNC